MFSILDVCDVHKNEVSPVDESAIDRRGAVACLGKLVQDRVSLREAVENHCLNWNTLVQVCGVHAMDFFLGAASPAAKVEASSAQVAIRGLFTKARAAREWAAQVDLKTARRVRGNSGAHHEVRVTYEHLRALKIGPAEVAALCGEIDNEFRARAGLHSEESVRALGWDLEALAPRRAVRKKPFERHRVILDL
ncbi:hypothetical protein CYMTET_35639 [Cymbomonas tetramitiformis]|uniref:Uncharacterized protein n=1 Tax=Cymbomonas tetramitiformis TaxID=36881 RepID=A0AAE0KNK8_9CHLO|nr:hypothetical protein CYMTET_35639 [Cymbomonas tetramitiformis]|eukprot:gene41-62_t